jgi:two-component sensor histidine kinase
MLLHPSGGPLRLRLLLTVTVALLPIAIASFMQGVDRAHRDMSEVRDRLVATVRLTATPEQNVLAAADQIARVVANLPQVRDAEPGCDQELASALKGIAFFTNISRVDANGRIICSALPGRQGRMVADVAALRGIANHRDFIVSGQVLSALTRQPIIRGMLPLHDADGKFAGTVDITIDVHWLDYMIRASQLPRDSIVALFDSAGSIIASNDIGAATALFRRPPDPRNTNGLRTESDALGRTWLYATAALLGDNVFIGFAMRQSTLFAPTYINVGTDFGMPFLMLALTWIAIWIVTEQEVTRWIAHLRRISAAYRAGHYTLRPKLEGAPSEFQILGDALSDMAESIQDRDRSLREAVAQKTLLIREIHHRVKNNLQIVMSLLSLQATRLEDPAAQEALRLARTRINALALVHRILHEIEDQHMVDVKPLLEQLTEQTNEGFGGDRRDIDVDVDVLPVRVPGAIAVPIALCVVEALTNAYKHAYPNGRGGTITVRLNAPERGQLCLAIIDDGVGLGDMDPKASIGGRLIKTFGQQLGGTTELYSAEGEGTTVELLFPDPAYETTDPDTSERDA